VCEREGGGARCRLDTNDKRRMCQRCGHDVCHACYNEEDVVGEGGDWCCCPELGLRGAGEDRGAEEGQECMPGECWCQRQKLNALSFKVNTAQAWP
jgi:hypothetical protein